MTETSYASASTATPPRLLDTDLGFGQSDDLDDFGDMFEGIGDGRKRISQTPEAIELRVADVIYPFSYLHFAANAYSETLDHHLPSTAPSLNDCLLHLRRR